MTASVALYDPPVIVVSQHREGTSGAPHVLALPRQATVE